MTSNREDVDSLDTSADVEMVKEINYHFSNESEDLTFGGSGVSRIISYRWHMRQLTLKVDWSSRETS